MDRIYTAKTVREKKKRKDIKEQTYLQFCRDDFIILIIYALILINDR